MLILVNQLNLPGVRISKVYVSRGRVGTAATDWRPLESEGGTNRGRLASEAAGKTGADERADNAGNGVRSFG